MSSNTAKRGRGRPKGSRNKRNNLSAATVRQICDYHKFNPAEKLIAIANNDDWDGDTRINWPLALQQRATEKLFESIHGSKALPGGSLDGETGNQYEIVFLEAEANFQLPREANAEGGALAMQPEPVQRTGDSPQGWQDSICDKQADT